MREKLIDVFMHLDRHIENRDEYGICFTTDFVEAVEKVLEMLKNQDTNGVTVQEWVSVKDRLPKPFTPVLVYRKSFGTLPPYIKVDKMILEYDDTQVWTDEVGNWKNVTTHWMPLPQPPKGE